MTQPGPDDQSPAQPGQPAGWTKNAGPAPAEPTRAAQLPPVPPPPPGAPAGPPPGGWAPQGQPGQPYAQWGPGQPGQPQGAWAPQGQPGQPYGQWAPGQQPVNPAVPRGKKKWPATVGGVVVLAGLGTAGALFASGGEPEVGDCIRSTADSFETVDCDASEAEYKVLGKEDEQRTFIDASADPSICAAWPDTTYVAWYGTAEDEEGTVYCAGDIG